MSRESEATKLGRRSFLKGAAAAGAAVAAGASPMAKPAATKLPSENFITQSSDGESIIAPAGTPVVVARLNKALGEVLAQKELREKLIALGLEPDGTKNPAETAQFVRSEMAKWHKVVKERNVTVE